MAESYHRQSHRWICGLDFRFADRSSFSSDVAKCLGAVQYSIV
jgi:hypothetical protein